MLFGGVALGATVGSALKKRIEVDQSEVAAQMFGDLSKTEVRALRSQYADRAGIRYGVGSSKVIDAAVEGLKAGIPKKFAGEFAELSLKAQAGLDVSGDDVAKLMGRLATQIDWNQARFGEILNSIAVANNSTAADGGEIIEAMRRSLSALATTKMTPEQLAALDSTGISLGIQPHKMGTFTSFLTSQIAGANSARGQQAKDLASAARALGFGGRGDMAKVMRDTPMEAIQRILDSLASMPEALRTKVAKQLGGREWMDELLTVVLGRNKLKDVLKDVQNKPGFIDKTALMKIRSLQGRWASISAAFGLLWEKIGGGWETMLTQVSDAVINLADKFDFNSVQSHFAALVDGLRDGFGLKSWEDAVRSVANSFDAGTIGKWREFGAGFFEGVRDFVSGVKTAFSGVAFLFGKSPTGARDVGDLIAKVTGLVLALAVAAPVLSVIASITAFVAGLGVLAGTGGAAIAIFVAGILIFHRALSNIADKIFSAFTGIVDPVVNAIKSIATKVWDSVRGWFGFGPSGSGRHGASGSWESGATDFSGSRRAKQSFDYSSQSFKAASYTTESTAAPKRFSQIGGDFGRRSSAVMNQLMADFSLTREQAAGIVGNLGHESSGMRALNEAKPLIPGSRGGFGWAQWTGPRRREFEAWAKANGLDIRSDEANYGFLKHELMGKYRGVIDRVRRTKTMEQSMYAFENGYEKAGVKAYSSRLKWGRRAMDSYTPNITLPASPTESATKNVPLSPSAELLKRHGSALLGAGGPVAININGGSHDPEALASLVQRRIDERWNWRTHDVEPEVT